MVYITSVSGRTALPFGLGQHKQYMSSALKGDVRIQMILGCVSGRENMTLEVGWRNLNAVDGRVIASMPEDMVMDVFNLVSTAADPDISVYMKFMEKGEDDERIYKPSLKFKDMEKKKESVDCGCNVDFIWRR